MTFPCCHRIMREEEYRKLPRRKIFSISGMETRSRRMAFPFAILGNLTAAVLAAAAKYQ